MKNGTFNVWFCVHKNGHYAMFLDMPSRNDLTGKWESKFPFINSILYEQICKLIDKANMKWESEPECISFKIN